MKHRSRTYLTLLGLVDVQQSLHVAIGVVHVHVLEGNRLVGRSSSVVAASHFDRSHLPSHQTLQLRHHQTNVLPVRLLALGRVRFL